MIEECEYIRDSKDIYNQLNELKDKIHEAKLDRDKRFEEIETALDKLINAVQNLAIDVKVERTKTNMRVGILTFVLTTLFTVVLENVVGGFNFFKIFTP